MMILWNQKWPVGSYTEIWFLICRNWTRGRISPQISYPSLWETCARTEGLSITSWSVGHQIQSNTYECNTPLNVICWTSRRLTSYKLHPYFLLSHNFQHKFVSEKWARLLGPFGRQTGVFSLTWSQTPQISQCFSLVEIKCNIVLQSGLVSVRAMLYKSQRQEDNLT